MICSAYRLAVITFILFLTSVGPAAAQIVVPVANESDKSFSIWIWSNKEGTWIDRPLRIGPGDSRTINIEQPGSHFVVIRNERGGEHRLGWVDFEKLVSLYPDFRIAIKSVMMQRVIEHTETVYAPVWETKTATACMTELQFINGQWQEVQVEKEVEYQVVRMVPEQKVRLKVVEEDGPIFNFFSQGAPIRPQVRFRTAQPGATVRYMPSGSNRVASWTNPTPATESVDPGRYTLWTERQGQITSQRQDRDVYLASQTFIIEERPEKP